LKNCQIDPERFEGFLDSNPIFVGKDDWKMVPGKLKTSAMIMVYNYDQFFDRMMDTCCTRYPSNFILPTSEIAIFIKDTKIA